MGQLRRFALEHALVGLLEGSDLLGLEPERWKQWQLLGSIALSTLRQRTHLSKFCSFAHPSDAVFAEQTSSEKSLQYSTASHCNANPQVTLVGA